MESALLYDRLQFAVTVTFHYLFPQLTMGLALLLLYLRTRALVTGDDHYQEVARFWTKIFALSFAFGVVTGIPLEFQFGTNWAKFSNFAGGVIGQTLAMEGIFAFFLESSFLGVLLYGEERFSPQVQWFAALMLFLGSWLSGYFILATNAWMQHPVAYTVAPDGRLFVNSLSGLLTNPWLLWQYTHNMTATVVTAAFVMVALGALYLLSGQHVTHAKTFLRTGVVAGAIACALMIFPTGDGNAKQVPRALSFLVYEDLWAELKGLDAFPREQWPDNVPLLYYTYHIMVGLGTILASVMALSLLMLWRGWLFKSKWLLWLLMLSAPFPYIATTAGWMTAELGRQPWLVYGVLRTAEGASPLVHAGNALFTLLGFLGMYLLLGLLFLFFISQTIREGPVPGVRKTSRLPVDGSVEA